MPELQFLKTLIVPRALWKLQNWVHFSIFSYLTHSARKYFEKLAFKKKPKKTVTLNCCISKARANSELKLTESPFNFLQNKVVFCTLYPPGYTAKESAPYNPQCHCQRFAGLKELKLFFVWINGNLLL